MARTKTKQGKSAQTEKDNNDAVALQDHRKNGASKPDASTAGAMTHRVETIPLHRLKASPDNARKTPHSPADIEALAASIAANDLLQNLIVAPERSAKGEATGFYLVTAGEGRRQAFLLLAKRKQAAKDIGIRCFVDDRANAHEISLAEIIIRTAMHPADQYEAFARLHDREGMSAEDIAARFGVSLATVLQRLKLGKVSPALRQAYREGAMNLDQLTAFTITDDHARQERVWADLPPYDRSRYGILRALAEGQVPHDDRRALYVGRDAYEQAGGTFTLDLFDEEGGGYFADAQLLDRLVGEKLQRDAEPVRAEGWSWVSVAADFDYDAASRMRRIPAPRPVLTPDEESRLDEIEQILEQFEDDEDEDSTAQRETLEVEYRAITERDSFTPDQKARAGAIVCLGSDGQQLRHASGATTDTIIGNANARRMTDDAAPVEMREHVGDASNKVPGSLASGEKIGHVCVTVLDELLDVFRPVALSNAVTLS